MDPQGPSEPNGNQEEPPQDGSSGEAQTPGYFPPPAQPPAWQQQPFQPPGYSYSMYPKQANGALILILGIVSIASILLCAGAGAVIGPIGWIMGNAALKDIEMGLADLAQRGVVNGGRVCSIIGTVLGGLFGIAMIVLFAYGMFSSIHGTSH